MADAKTDEIRNFVVGPIQTNCYAYVSGGACMVVDPGAAGAAVAEHLSDVRVECVVATHGHGDHVGGVSALVAACEAPFCINAADAERAMHAGEPSELGIAYDDDAPAPDRELSEGDVISLGTATFTVMETPRAASSFWAAAAPRAWPSWETRSSREATAAPTWTAATRLPSWPPCAAWQRRLPRRPRSFAATVPPPPWRPSWRETRSCGKSARGGGMRA